MGIGKLNGTVVTLGVLDLQFMEGSVRFVVGEKITHLFKYATKKLCH
jgi:acetyl-CoA carboxylase carboxyl transferase subunit beta